MLSQSIIITKHNSQNLEVEQITLHIDLISNSSQTPIITSSCIIPEGKIK